MEIYEFQELQSKAEKEGKYDPYTQTCMLPGVGLFAYYKGDIIFVGEKGERYKLIIGDGETSQTRVVTPSFEELFEIANRAMKEMNGFLKDVDKSVKNAIQEGQENKQKSEEEDLLSQLDAAVKGN